LNPNRPVRKQSLNRVDSVGIDHRK